MNQTEEKKYMKKHHIHDNLQKTKVTIDHIIISFLHLTNKTCTFCCVSIEFIDCIATRTAKNDALRHSIVMVTLP